MGKIKEKKKVEPPPPPEGGCNHYVERKSRYCKMLVKPGARFCGEHVSTTRSPCPYDPGHTCPSDPVGRDKHLSNCNSRPPDTKPHYLVTGVNLGDNRLLQSPSETIAKTTIGNISDENLLRIIKLVQSTYEKKVKSQIETKILEHEVLRTELCNDQYGPNVLKHHKQNSSLLGHLSNCSLMQNNSIFVEFGSGRGALSYWVGRALSSPSTCQMLLVDRASPRHKLDTRLQQDVSETKAKDDSGGVSVTRLRVDIADLHLGQALETIDEPITDGGMKNKVIGISKHLCGVATDLTLRCMIGTLPISRLGGFMIALCCHHRCVWSTYVGADFLLDQGFLPEDFSILTSISSWATCGFGRKYKNNVEDEHENETLADESETVLHPNDRYARLGLNETAREELGRQTKRILDYGRVRYLETQTNFSVKLNYYIESDVTLENALLICIPKN